MNSDDQANYVNSLDDSGTNDLGMPLNPALEDDLSPAYTNDPPTNLVGNQGNSPTTPPIDPSFITPSTINPTVDPSTDDSSDSAQLEATTAAHNNANHGTGDLLNIKQAVLQQLTPLVGQLEQTPEERFKTTMMMIQATDDQSLLKTAHQAAKQITDDKVRAQALLDIINEINYFTQKNQP